MHTFKIGQPPPGKPHKKPRWGATHVCQSNDQPWLPGTGSRDQCLPAKGILEQAPQAPSFQAWRRTPHQPCSSTARPAAVFKAADQHTPVQSYHAVAAAVQTAPVHMHTAQHTRYTALHADHPTRPHTPWHDLRLTDCTHAQCPQTNTAP